MQDGPFKYIENGYVRGMRKAGLEVIIWNGLDASELKGILEAFRPELFIGYLRRGRDRKNFDWVCGESFELLNRYRKLCGMKTALHANPDVQVLLPRLKLHFTEGDISNAEQFYSQPTPPTAEEKVLVDEGFIDFILHHYSRELTEVCFKYWLSNGIVVLAHPLAADDEYYTPPLLPKIKHYDISFIGGWWPFKGQQMNRHLLPMREKFGERLKVYGRNWPYLSNGHIADDEYMRIVWKSRINLVFHEPSQVHDFALHVNERIFKLYAMRAFAICDNNPCLREYFDDSEIVIADGPEDMIDKCEYYLRKPMARHRIANKGYRAVKARHTYSKRVMELLTAL